MLFIFCEPSGGQHQFVATDILNNAKYQSNFLNQNCNYSLQVTAANSLKRQTQQPSLQLFPFEYKPLNLFPASVSVQTPAGWVTDTDNGGNVTIKIESQRPDGGWAVNSFQVPATTNPFIINIGQLGD